MLLTTMKLHLTFATANNFRDVGNFSDASTQERPCKVVLKFGWQTILKEQFDLIQISYERNIELLTLNKLLCIAVICEGQAI